MISWGGSDIHNKTVVRNLMSLRIRMSKVHELYLEYSISISLIMMAFEYVGPCLEF